MGFPILIRRHLYNESGPRVLCNTGYPFETQLILMSREIEFAHNALVSCQINRFEILHRVLSQIFINDLDVKDERNVTRFEFDMRFGQIFYTTRAPCPIGIQIWRKGSHEINCQDHMLILIGPVMRSYIDLNRCKFGLVGQKQVSGAATSNVITQYLWDVIICPYPWYLFLAHKSSIQQQLCKGYEAPRHKTSPIRHQAIV